MLMRGPAAPDTTDEAGSGTAAFRLDGVGFSVDGHRLLQEVDLELVPGRVHGLIGHNGSGKSTLMKILARQQSASEGSVTYGGVALDQWSHRPYAREVAYLPQHLPEATGLTVRELAELGRYPWLGALRRFGTRDREQVDEALRLTGMEPLADRLVDTLSGGERQRAWLAMLVAQEGRCMLLDEPVSALDVSHQIEVMDLVRNLCRERGMTVVAVLHDVNLAARYCDVLIALREGAKVIEGSPETVVEPDALEQIYGIGMGVMRHPRLQTPISYVA